MRCRLAFPSSPPGRLIAASMILFLAACKYVTTLPPSAATPTTPGTTAGSTTLTYTTDVQPILASDCVRCHGPSNRQADVDLSTYASVLRTLTPGDANSLLVLATLANGPMFSQFSGNRTTKSMTIHDWVVSSGAAQ